MLSSLTVAPPDPALDINDLEAAGFRNGQLTIVLETNRVQDVRCAAHTHMLPITSVANHILTIKMIDM
jgi:hypothetical protein